MAVITQLPPDERPRGGTRVVRAQQMQNEVTRIAPLDAQVRALHKPLATLEDEAEWSATFERLQSWRKEHIERDGLAVVVRSAGENGRPRFDVALAAADGAPHALIVGRHARADVALPAEGNGSLRHAAVVLWPGPRAVAIDLKSNGGLRTRDGKSARRLASTTALHFGAGDADVFALVAKRDEPFAIRFPDELDAHVSGALVDDLAPAPAVLPADAWERSRVFRTGDTRAILGEIARGLVVHASAADVARGIVLGRYERCHRTNALAARDEVSRVHALVFAVDHADPKATPAAMESASTGTLWIVDTASTAGTVLVDEKTGARTMLGEGHRIAPLTPTTRVLLAGVDVQIDVTR